MLKDIVEISVVGTHRLHLKFEDGAEGEIDLTRIVPFEGVFAPLRDAKLFAEVTVDRDLGTIRWPNGADLDPDVLYALITGEPMPNLTRRAAPASAS